METENTIQDPPNSDVVSSPREIDPALKAQVKGFLPDLAKDLQTLLHSRQRRQSSGHTTNLQMDPIVQDLL